MGKSLVYLILLTVIFVELTVAFLGGGPGKRSSDANKLYQRQQQQQQQQVIVDTGLESKPNFSRLRPTLSKRSFSLADLCLVCNLYILNISYFFELRDTLSHENFK